MKEYVDFFKELGQLKLNKREGWRNLGVLTPESIADHSLRAAQIGFFIAKKEGADPYKTATILLFHELGEARIGDLDLLARKYLIVDEKKAVEDMLPEAEKNEVLSLWLECDNKTTKEGIIAKDADYIELILQAKEYSLIGYDTHEHIKNARALLVTDTAKKLCEFILQ